MSTPIAALPMYDWPEDRAETDAIWAGLRDRLRHAGIEAPERLARRNADLPSMPGGIRDDDGRPVAPDPATLDPDGLDLPALWRHPDLLFAQTCWGPMRQGLAAHVAVLGQPDYSRFEGGNGALYSSAVLMRRSLPSPLWGGSPAGQSGGHRGQAPSVANPTPAPRADLPKRDFDLARPSDLLHKEEGKAAVLPLDRLRDTRFAFNGTDSMSGLIALDEDLLLLGQSLAIFSERIETGAHRASIVAVAEGRADVCAIDCRTFDLARRFEPRTADLDVVGWTAPRAGLPYVAARRFAGHGRLKDVVAAFVREQA